MANEEGRHDNDRTIELLKQEFSQLATTVAEHQSDINALKAKPPASDVLIRIAVALETIAARTDDSEQVKQLTEKLKASGDALQSAIDATTPKNP